MSRWLLVATHGDPLSSLGQAHFVAFESRGEADDAKRPARADVEEAALELARRSEVPVEKIGRMVVTLVPLEDAVKLELVVGVRAELSARVGGGV